MLLSVSGLQLSNFLGNHNGVVMKYRCIKILYIEDDPTEVFLVKELLREIEHLNFDLKTECDLKSGLQSLKHNSFDIVLLDMGLPDSSGENTVHTIVDNCSDTAIIVLTGLDDFKTSLDILDYGVQDYLVKGQYSPELLYKSIVYAIERKNFEKKLLASSEKTLKYLNIVAEIVMTIDFEGHIMQINNTGCKLLGYSENEVIGKNWFKEFMREEDRCEFVDYIKAILETSENQIFFNESTIVTADGKNRIISWRNKLIVDKVKGFRGVLCSGQDVTEKKSVEEQLYQSQRLESIGRLAGGIAHDFNNLLSVILGYSEIAMLSLSKEDRLYEDIHEISAAAERSKKITRQLLTFARKDISSPRKINVIEHINGMYKMIKCLIGEDIDLNIKDDCKKCNIYIDPSHLDQIIMNLSVNARDAVAGVGGITISVHNIEECRGAEGIVVREKFVQIKFTDSGCGMSEDVVNKVFEPFFTTKKVGQGTGLGLSTVYGIVKQNRGFIEIESKEHYGTTFLICFPQTEDASEINGHYDIKHEFHVDNVNILLVEDDEKVIKMVRRMLELLGFNIHACTSPKQALNEVLSGTIKVDLLITDVIMPDINGRDLALQISQRYPDVKILFMSGYSKDVILERTHFAENLNYIHKPFTQIELVEKLKLLL